MSLMDLIPFISPTILFAFVLWLSRNLIITRLTKSVQHEFNIKIESLRNELTEKEEILKADLRSKESEIATLRSSVISAMANRQVELDKRRLDAIDQLWSAVIALGPAKTISTLLAPFKFEEAAKEAVHNEKLREMFRMLGSKFDTTKIDFSIALKARPFVSPMAWAIYTAYAAIVWGAVIRFEVLKTGLEVKGLFKEDKVIDLVKLVLPHQEEYIKKYGYSAYHYLIEELEDKLLNEFKKMMAGVESDVASIKQAAEILKLSTEYLETSKKSNITIK